MKESIVRDSHFTEVSESRVDSKNRLCLPKAARGTHVYKVYRNDSGQLILDPQVLVPAAEAWLYENPRALASVKRGLAQAAEGDVVALPPVSKKRRA